MKYLTYIFIAGLMTLVVACGVSTEDNYATVEESLVNQVVETVNTAKPVSTTAPKPTVTNWTEPTQETTGREPIATPMPKPTNTPEPLPTAIPTPIIEIQSPADDHKSVDDHRQDEDGGMALNGDYDILCVDDVLGLSRSDEIFYDGKPLTTGEMDRIRHCARNETDEVSEGEDEGSGRAMEDQQRESDPTGRSLDAWRPAPKDTECADKVLGIKAYREIYQGERAPSESESEAWKKCLPTLSLDSIVHPVADIQCPSIETMWENRHTFAPRWEQIECQTDSLIRYDLPKFRAHDRFRLSGSDPIAASIWPFSLNDLLTDLIATDWEEYDQSQYDGRDQDLWKVMELLEENLSGNWAFMPMSDFPPYIDEFWKNIVYPPSDYWHDQALRVFALHALQRKSKGHPVVMVDFYPPGMLSAPTSSSSEFREWIDNVFVPQKIHEAKVAELLKAEILFPLPIEIERWIQAQPWANNTPVQEKIRTAQYVLDHVHDGVRPIFSGKLDVWSYANYLPDRDGADWASLVFADYDEVSFHLFPECDLEFSVMYTQNQMNHVMDIVIRDGLTWWIGEWDMNNKYFKELCGTNMAKESVSIMEAMLDVIFAQPVQPIGIDYRGQIYSAEHLNVIEDRIFGKEDGN